MANACLPACPIINFGSDLNLVIDIGNTRTKAAVFNGGRILKTGTWDQLSLELLQQFLYNHPVKNVILSSVSDVPAAIEDYLEKKFFYRELKTETPLPVVIQYKTPETLGKDRIAAVAGAQALYPGTACLVIDAGTCITMDVVTEAGVFVGGNISPGIYMRLKAMHHFTSRLPLVRQKWPKTDDDEEGQLLGNSTESALRNGGELGALLEVEGFIAACNEQFQHLTVLFTGGDADFFVKKLKTKIFAHPNLVLVGLNKILQYNVEIFEGN